MNAVASTGDLSLLLVINVLSIALLIGGAGRWLRNRLTAWVREPVRALETQVKKLGNEQKHTAKRVTKVERRQRTTRKDKPNA